MAPLTTMRGWLCCCLLAAGLLAPPQPAAAAAPTEQQVKAVFVFNFSHFVEWPADTFASPTEPFVIGVLGSEALVAQLNEAVRGERIDTHPLLVRHFRSIDEIVPCQILFIAQAEGAQLQRVLASVDGKRTLTVSDLDGASQRGVMIQFFNANNRVRLRINVDSVRAAGLTISSNLLRPAEIVRTSNRE
jgi:YfiR/HmsC-like